jgi:putative transposase
MQKLAALEFGKYYHIYNRGINREKIFFEPRNYRYFMDLYAKYIAPVADTLAYSLLGNHFHLLVRIKTAEEQTFQVLETRKLLNPTQQFSNLFNAYAKAINKAYHRTGGLFQERFGRIEVTSDEYFATLVVYIHRNSQKHGIIEDFREYPYSSYAAMLVDKPTQLKRSEVLEWFGGIAAFTASHQNETDEKCVGSLVEEDD